MADPIVNFFKSTLVGTYSDTDTSFTIATGDGSLLPDPSTDGEYNLTIFRGLQVNANTTFEIVRVTARSGDVLTVTRGQEGTSALTVDSEVHSILMSATKKTFDDINDAIANVDLTNLTGVEELTFDSTGDEEFGLPAGTTAQRPSNPSLGYMRYNTDASGGVEVYNGNRWFPLGGGFAQLDLGVAESGVTGNDAVLTGPLEVEYLVIAGGGGGGFYQAGGGGAGGYRSSVSGESSGGGASAESPLELDGGINYCVVVGAGGPAGASFNPGAQGSSSQFITVSSSGGGGGGNYNNNGCTGGSGGGGGFNRSGGAGTASQGFSGGAGFTSNPGQGGGGGGGAGSVGVSAGSTLGGDGGTGVSSSITGSSIARAGGGGGSGYRCTVNGEGQAGGGDGAYSATSPSGSFGATAGCANTGGGGGGGTEDNPFRSGCNGGSGVVILRYPSSYSITIGAGLTGSETTVGGNKVATITAGSGNICWG